MREYTPFAAFKRCIEYFEADPDFRTRFLSDGRTAVASLGFYDLPDPDAAVEGIRQICIEGIGNVDDRTQINNPYLKAFFAAIDEVSASVRRSHAENSFRNRELYVYANRVRSRCRMENRILRWQENVQYYPLCFELGYGCRPQCSFCGFAAPPFEENYPYTNENRDLWRTLLTGMRERLGPIAATAVCYFATEPFDNPDYELFLGDFEDIMGDIPQTTTAAADVDPGRVKAFLARVGEERLRRKASVRFSVRSLAQFQRIMELYSPDELAYVELLINNPESAGRYSDSGRTRLSAQIPDEKRCRYSINCVAGIRVNMARRTIRFIEPMLPDAKYPTGIRTRAETRFDGADDFFREADRMYAEYAAGFLRPERTITLNPNIRTETVGSTIRFCGDGISYRVSRGYVLETALEGLPTGTSFSELRAKLGLFPGTAEELYEHLNALYMRGYLIDAREKEEP